MGVIKDIQKEKIERLEREIEKKEEIIKTLFDYIDNNEEIIKLQEEYIKLLKNNKSIKEIKKIHNERGAGRKQRFSEQEKKLIRIYKTQGKTIREISEIFNCSIRTINRALSNS
jgi:hypothetical protein